MATGKYHLKKASNGQFHWTLAAKNGVTILSSELYVSKAGAQGGIASCKVNSPIDSRYEKRTSSRGEPYFILKAANGEPIGTSEMYSSASARDDGIKSCKENGPDSPTEDHAV